MNWDIEIGFHFPHDRCAIGWEWFRADEEYNYTTVRLFIFIMTITLNF